MKVDEEGHIGGDEKKKKKKEIERQIETGKELGRKFITIKQKVMIFLLKSIKYAIALLNQLKN